MTEGERLNLKAAASLLMASDASLSTVLTLFADFAFSLEDGPAELEAAGLDGTEFEEIEVVSIGAELDDWAAADWLERTDLKDLESLSCVGDVVSCIAEYLRLPETDIEGVGRDGMSRSGSGALPLPVTLLAFVLRDSMIEISSPSSSLSETGAETAA